MRMATTPTVARTHQFGLRLLGGDDVIQRVHEAFIQLDVELLY